MMNISACGLICDECQFFNNPCSGCYNVAGKTFWAKEHFTNAICPLYDCAVNENNFNNCGECSKLPCNTFKDLKDPNISEEEHKLSIQKRVDILKSN